MSDFRSVEMRRFAGAVGEIRSQIGSLEQKVKEAQDQEARRILRENGKPTDDYPVEPQDLDVAYELDLLEMMVGVMKNLAERT